MHWYYNLLFSKHIDKEGCNYDVVISRLHINKLAFGQTRFSAAADPIEHISEENFLLQIFKHISEENFLLQIFAKSCILYRGPPLTVSLYLIVDPPWKNRVVSCTVGPPLTVGSCHEQEEEIPATTNYRRRDPRYHQLYHLPWLLPPERGADLSGAGRT